MGGIHKRMSIHVDIYPLIFFLQPVVYLKKNGYFGYCGRKARQRKARSGNRSGVTFGYQ